MHVPTLKTAEKLIFMLKRLENCRHLNDVISRVVPLIGSPDYNTC